MTTDDGLSRVGQVVKMSLWVTDILKNVISVKPNISMIYVQTSLLLNIK